MRLLGLAVLALVAEQAYGQTSFQRFNFTVGAGAAQPRGELRDYFATSPVMNVAFGYRFHPYFQADVGFDTAFGAAGVRDFLPTAFGDLRIRDYQYFVPMGGRVVVPLASDRVFLSAGGGGAYMRYSERVRQPYRNGGYRIDCAVCNVRDGWGYYALAAASVAVDRYNHFRLGVTGKVYRGHTDGQPLGLAPPLRTRDHWVNIGADFTVSF